MKINLIQTGLVSLPLQNTLSPLESSGGNVFAVMLAARLGRGQSDAPIFGGTIAVAENMLNTSPSGLIPCNDNDPRILRPFSGLVNFDRNENIEQVESCPPPINIHGKTISLKAVFSGAERGDPAVVCLIPVENEMTLPEHDALILHVLDEVNDMVNNFCEKSDRSNSMPLAGSNAEAKPEETSASPTVQSVLLLYPDFGDPRQVEAIQKLFPSLDIASFISTDCAPFDSDAGFINTGLEQISEQSGLYPDTALSDGLGLPIGDPRLARRSEELQELLSTANTLHETLSLTGFGYTDTPIDATASDTAMYRTTAIQFGEKETIPSESAGKRAASSTVTSAQVFAAKDVPLPVEPDGLTSVVRTEHSGSEPSSITNILTTVLPSIESDGVSSSSSGETPDIGWRNISEANSPESLATAHPNNRQQNSSVKSGTIIFDEFVKQNPVTGIAAETVDSALTPSDAIFHISTAQPDTTVLSEIELRSGKIISPPGNSLPPITGSETERFGVNAPKDADIPNPASPEGFARSISSPRKAFFPSITLLARNGEQREVQVRIEPVNLGNTGSYDTSETFTEPHPQVEVNGVISGQSPLERLFHDSLSRPEAAGKTVIIGRIIQESVLASEMNDQTSGLTQLKGAATGNGDKYSIGNNLQEVKPAQAAVYGEQNAPLRFVAGIPAETIVIQDIIKNAPTVFPSDIGNVSLSKSEIALSALSTSVSKSEAGFSPKERIPLTPSTEPEITAGNKVSLPNVSEKGEIIWTVKTENTAPLTAEEAIEKEVSFPGLREHSPIKATIGESNSGKDAVNHEKRITPGEWKANVRAGRGEDTALLTMDEALSATGSVSLSKSEIALSALSTAVSKSEAGLSSKEKIPLTPSTEPEITAGNKVSLPNVSQTWEMNGTTENAAPLTAEEAIEKDVSFPGLREHSSTKATIGESNSGKDAVNHEKRIAPGEWKANVRAGRGVDMILRTTGEDLSAPEYRLAGSLVSPPDSPPAASRTAAYESYSRIVSSKSVISAASTGETSQTVESAGQGEGVSDRIALPSEIFMPGTARKINIVSPIKSGGEIMLLETIPATELKGVSDTEPASGPNMPTMEPADSKQMLSSRVENAPMPLNETEKAGPVPQRPVQTAEAETVADRPTTRLLSKTIVPDREILPAEDADGGGVSNVIRREISRSTTEKSGAAHSRSGKENNIPVSDSGSAVNLALRGSVSSNTAALEINPRKGRPEQRDGSDASSVAGSAPEVEESTLALQRENVLASLRESRFEKRTQRVEHSNAEIRLNSQSASKPSPTNGATTLPDSFAGSPAVSRPESDEVSGAFSGEFRKTKLFGGIEAKSGGEEDQSAIRATVEKSVAAVETKRNSGHISSIAHLHDPSEFESDILNSIVRQARFMLQGGNSRASITLDPPSLGKMKLEIVTENSKVTGKIMVESREVQEIIRNNMDDLRQSLSQGGLRVESFDVQVGHNGDTDNWAKREELESAAALLRSNRERIGAIQSESMASSEIRGRNMSNGPGYIDMWM